MSKHVWPALLFLVLFVCELMMVCRLNEGTFTYSLDDAYIHLALAQRINQGQYGINPCEASAPSSSILWPLLLAPFADRPSFVYLPLFLNVIGALVILYISGRFFHQQFSGSPRPWLAIALTLFMIPALNLIGLVFTGMEHILQILVALLVANGLIRLHQDRFEGVGFYAASLLGPLIRFENTLLALVSVLCLLAHKKSRAALIILSGVILSLSGFSFFLQRLHLGYLPSSIITKSVTVFGGHTSLFINLMTNLSQRQAVAMLLCLLLFLNRLTLPFYRYLNLGAVGAIAGHMLFGRFGWADRYEIYLLGFCFFILVAQHQVDLIVKPLLAGSATLIVLLIPYWQNWLYTPLGCNNIYQQHAQMARFAQEYVRAPVAVNDLGCVAFNNQQHVLDLWGLASPEVIALKRQRFSCQWMDSLAQVHQVKVAMIYDAYFPLLPQNWVCLGKLFLGRRKITADHPIVSFYAVQAHDVAELKQSLRLFARTLPRGVVFTNGQGSSPY